LSPELIVEPPQCLMLTDNISRGREPPAPDRDLIGLVVPSSALSCQQTSEGADLCTAVVVKHWRLLHEATRSQYSQWYATDGW